MKKATMSVFVFCAVLLGYWILRQEACWMLAAKSTQEFAVSDGGIFFVFWVPAMFILVTSIWFYPAEGGFRKIFWFYLAVIASSLFGAMHPMVGLVAGATVCGLSAGFFGALLGGIFVGMVTGCLINACGYGPAIQYVLFLLTAEAISFGLAYGIHKVLKETSSAPGQSAGQC